MVPATRFIHGTLVSGFHILVGGKMGSGGFTIASNLEWFIHPDQAHDVVIQIIKLFHDEGTRGARTQCRLAFLLERAGVRIAFVKSWSGALDGSRGRPERMPAPTVTTTILEYAGRSDLVFIPLVCVSASDGSAMSLYASSGGSPTNTATARSG